MWTTIKNYLKKSYVWAWFIEIVTLTIFWLVVLPSYLDVDYIWDPRLTYAVRDLLTMCSNLSINVFARRLAIAMLLNLLFNFTVRFCNLRRIDYNIISVAIGTVILLTNLWPQNLPLVIGFLIITWMLLRHSKIVLMDRDDIIRPVYFVTFSLVTILIAGELFFPDRANWRESRGVMMILAMKMISISTQDFVVANISDIEFLGYMLCPPTLPFGPWISIQDYVMNHETHPRLNWKWAVKIVQIFTYAMISMVISNCLNHIFHPPTTSAICKWYEAFRDAWMFRARNYYVAYMAELMMITGGFNDIYGNQSGAWKYEICRPLSVEFPRSMAVVIRSWNIPVHHFLKSHIYIPNVLIGKAQAVVVTFIVSSLFHGFNIRIAAILITLAVLSLSQQMAQDRLADRINSCCKTMPCRPHCGHRFRFCHPITLIINGINVVINMVHLAYLGYIMDENFNMSTWSDLYNSWEEDFGLFTHHVIIFWIGTVLLLV